MAIFDPLWSCLQLFHFWAIKFYYLVIAISTQIGIYLGTYHEQLILANSNVSNFTKEWVITLKHTRSFTYLCNVYIKIEKYVSFYALGYSLIYIKRITIYVNTWVISRNFLIRLLFVFLVILLLWKNYTLCYDYNTKRNSKMLMRIISLCVWSN